MLREIEWTKGATLINDDPKQTETLTIIATLENIIFAVRENNPTQCLFPETIEKYKEWGYKIKED